MRKLLLLSILIFQLIGTDGFSQSSEDSSGEKYNSLSASVYGGYIFDERDRGQQIFASRFNVTSEPTYAIGTDVRYAVTAFWSVETGYRYSYLEGVGFETTMHTASVKSTFNLNRFYRTSSLSEKLNPYVILGVEQDWFDAEGPDEDFSRSEASLIGGLGLAFRISNRFELFGQHEIKLTSNHLDLIDRGYPYDQLGMATGGVRIHFGSSDRKPKNLAPAKKSITMSEYRDFSSQISRLEDLERDMSNLTERVDSLEKKVDRMDSEYSDKFNELYALIDSLDTRTDSLEAKTDCLCGEGSAQQAEEDEPVLRSTVPAGHYVQVFATRDRDSAVTMRNQFRELLKNDLENPGDEVFIIQRKQFFEVLIGTFTQFSRAQQVLPAAVSELSDSFIITFPRPVHLEEQYEGTSIIHEQ